MIRKINKNKMTELEKNVRDHQKFEKAIIALHLAIYGDEESKGMRDKIDEMYNIFVPVTITGRFVIKGILVLGSIAAALTAIWEFLGRKIK